MLFATTRRFVRRQQRLQRCWASSTTTHKNNHHNLPSSSSSSKDSNSTIAPPVTNSFLYGHDHLVGPPDLLVWKNNFTPRRSRPPETTTGESVDSSPINMRFTTTNAGAVVLVARLGLTEYEQAMLHEIVGPRWDPSEQTIRLTSHEYPSRMENQRHLVHLLDRLLASCRRLGRQKKEEEEQEERLSA